MTHESDNHQFRVKPRNSRSGKTRVRNALSFVFVPEQKQTVRRVRHEARNIPRKQTISTTNRLPQHRSGLSSADGSRLNNKSTRKKSHSEQSSQLHPRVTVNLPCDRLQMVSENCSFTRSLLFFGTWGASDLLS